MVVDFQHAVKEALALGLEGELALEFEVAKSTVWRWSEGVAKPHPRIQQKIVKFVVDQGVVRE